MTTYTYKWSDQSQEWLLYYNGACYGWIRENGPPDQRYIVKVYGFHVFPETTLTEAVLHACSLHKTYFASKPA